MKPELCPKCKFECSRDDVDVGVGIIYGPWGCGKCGWSEDSEYDLSEGQSQVDQKTGWIKDQFGGLHSPENPIIKAMLSLKNQHAKTN